MLQKSLLDLIEKEDSFFTRVSPLTHENILLALERNGLVLKYLKNPTSEMITLALKQNGMALQYVENQTEEYCQLAVKQCGRALQFVENQTESICRLAIEKYAPSFLYVKKQNETLSLLAIQKDARVFRMVKTQTFRLCQEAIRQNGLLLEYVWESFQTEELIRMALKQNIESIRFVKQREPWMIFEAIKAGKWDYCQEVLLDSRYLGEMLKTNPMKVVDCRVLTSEIIWTLHKHGTHVYRWIGETPCDEEGTREFFLWLWLLEGRKDKKDYYLELWESSISEEGKLRFNQFLRNINPFQFEFPSLEEYQKWYYEMLLMTDEQCLSLIQKEPIRLLALNPQRLTETFCFQMVQVNLQVYRYFPLHCRTSLISRYVVQRESSFKVISPYHGETEYYF